MSTQGKVGLNAHVGRQKTIVKDGRSAASNRRLTWAVLLCTVVVVLMVYFPWFNPLFGTRILAFVHLLPALPFAVFLVVYDELRKWHIRRHPDGTAAGDVARWDAGHR